MQVISPTEEHPILYNIYAADQSTSPNTAAAKYADDKTSSISIHTASLHHQNRLDILAVWYKRWRVGRIK